MAEYDARIEQNEGMPVVVFRSMDLFSRSQVDSTSPVERTCTSMERWRVKLLQRHMYSIY